GEALPAVIEDVDGVTLLVEVVDDFTIFQHALSATAGDHDCTTLVPPLEGTVAYRDVVNTLECSVPALSPAGLDLFLSPISCHLILPKEQILIKQPRPEAKVSRWPQG